MDSIRLLRLLRILVIHGASRMDLQQYIHPHRHSATTAYYAYRPRCPMENGVILDIWMSCICPQQETARWQLYPQLESQNLDQYLYGALPYAFCQHTHHVQP